MTTENHTETDYNPNRHILNAWEISTLRERLADYSRRAQRRGLDIEITLDVDMDSAQTVKRDRPFGTGRYTTTVYKCEVKGFAVIDGWRLIGSATYDSPTADPIVRTAAAGVEFERNRCDHCGRRARRKYVSVLENVETGERMQVGRSCSRDFLGKIITPTYEDALYEGFGLGILEEATPAVLIIAVALAVVEYQGGYTRGTTGIIVDKLVNHGGDRLLTGEREAINALMTDEKYDEAGEICAWIASTTEDSDYMRNLRAVASDPDADVIERRTKLVASAVAAWARHNAPVVPKQVSEWIGAIGDKANLTVTVEKIRAFDNQWGTSYLLIMRTADGNIVKTITTARWVHDDEVQEGATITLAATIKDHTRYGDEKQTVISSRRRIG